MRPGIGVAEHQIVLDQLYRPRQVTPGLGVHRLRGKGDQLSPVQRLRVILQLVDRPLLEHDQVAVLASEACHRVLRVTHQIVVAHREVCRVHGHTVVAVPEHGVRLTGAPSQQDAQAILAAPGEGVLAVHDRVIRIRVIAVVDDLHRTAGRIVGLWRGVNPHIFGVHSGELARRGQEKSVPRVYCGGEGEHACVTIIGKVGRCRNLRVDTHSADRRVQPAGEPGQLIRLLAADRRHLYGVLIEVLHTVHEDLLGVGTIICGAHADVELEGVRGDRRFKELHHAGGQAPRVPAYDAGFLLVRVGVGVSQRSILENL